MSEPATRAEVPAATTGLASTVTCAGCGYRAADDDPLPFRCPNAGSDDVDHVMVRRLDPARVRFPAPSEPGGGANPFVRYRALFHAAHLAAAHGLSDAEHVALIEELDGAVAAVDGRGFRPAPFARADELSRRLGFEPPGGVWVKDETGNVSGSHKARHLMGLMLHLRTVEAAGLAPGGSASRGSSPDLAIASCGNAALAAAVVARASEGRLLVFVPERADPAIVAALEGLGAVIERCPRRPGVAGDPTYHRLHEAIAAGAVPFTCQGPDAGLTIEGGETLAWELVTELLRDGLWVDRIVIQVGGGALASAVIRGFDDAIALGAEVPRPTYDTVQTEGGWPLRRAWLRFAHHVLERLGHGDAERRTDRELAELLVHPSARERVEAELAAARSNRSAFMWPWEEEPTSVATGILDDETYDWAAVLEGTVRTGGVPLVVDEPTLLEANALARETTGIDVDHTGSAGLAGLLALLRDGGVDATERVVVLFTGARRGPSPAEADGLGAPRPRVDAPGDRNDEKEG